MLLPSTFMSPTLFCKWSRSSAIAILVRRSALPQTSCVRSSLFWSVERHHLSHITAAAKRCSHSLTHSLTESPQYECSTPQHSARAKPYVRVQLCLFAQRVPGKSACLRAPRSLVVQTYLMFSQADRETEATYYEWHGTGGHYFELDILDGMVIDSSGVPYVLAPLIPRRRWCTRVAEFETRTSQRIKEPVPTGLAILALAAPLSGSSVSLAACIPPRCSPEYSGATFQ